MRNAYICTQVKDIVACATVGCNKLYLIIFVSIVHSRELNTYCILFGNDKRTFRAGWSANMYVRSHSQPNETQMELNRREERRRRRRRCWKKQHEVDGEKSPTTVKLIIPGKKASYKSWTANPGIFAIYSMATFWHHQTQFKSYSHRDLPSKTFSVNQSKLWLCMMRCKSSNEKMQN